MPVGAFGSLLLVDNSGCPAMHAYVVERMVSVSIIALRISVTIVLLFVIAVTIKILLITD